MNTNLLKLVFTLCFLTLGISLKAQQTQTLCTQEVKEYTVDKDNPTAGSTYDWTLTDSSSTDLTFIIQDNGSNNVSIDWSSGTVGETYTLTVVEKNGGCPGEPKIAIIELINGYTAPTIDAFASALCNTDEDADDNIDNEFFNLTGGTAGANVTYTIASNINGEVVAETTISLDATGNATIPVPALANPQVTEEFTLTLVSIDGGTGSACGAIALTEDNTQTVTVNPIPETTDINFD